MKSNRLFNFAAVLTFVFMASFAISTSFAQVTDEATKTETNQQTKKKPEAKAVGQETKPKVPAPENVTLQTKDGVQLKCTYYEGKKDKATIPVILVHDFASKREHVDFLAKYLQAELGCAVIAPDLRGHGESLRVEGKKDDLDRKRFKNDQYASMTKDIERCKKFLMRKNNDGHANIEMLTVVAVGASVINAANWCITDWSWPALGSVKQGQDVKCLIMLLPVKRYKGLSLTQALKHSLLTGKGQTPLSLQVIWSKSKASDAPSICEIIAKSRKKLSDKEFKATGVKDKMKPATKNDPESAGMTEALKAMADFMRVSLVQKKDELRWQDRAKK